jgi:hypothetical protein
MSIFNSTPKVPPSVSSSASPSMLLAWYGIITSFGPISRST